MYVTSQKTRQTYLKSLLRNDQFNAQFKYTFINYVQFINKYLWFMLYVENKIQFTIFDMKQMH